MAGMNNDFIIKPELRPCIVNGQKALFHQWIKAKDILQSEYPKGIIEYKNGQVATVGYYDIKFIDNKITEYSFDNNTDAEEILNKAKIYCDKHDGVPRNLVRILYDLKEV